ncbi:MAG: ankyrin repeat domain-containing protein [Pseudomonadota bacterium]
MKYHDILAAELHALLAEPDLLILDIRDEASYARGHLEHAQLASDALLERLFTSRQRQRPILVYCYHGNSSRDISQFIAGFGFLRVHNLVGGWQAWEHHLATQQPATPSTKLAAWLNAQGLPSDDIHACLDRGMSSLMLAALQGDGELMDELLALGANPNQLNDDRHHALWFACVHGKPELVSRLLEHGADVDNQNINGATCAIYAASTGKLDVLQRLVEAGANLGMETNVGYNALESAATLPVLKYLRGLTTERTALPA